MLGMCEDGERAAGEGDVSESDVESIVPICFAAD